MACNCGTPDSINSYIDIQRTPPKNILDYLGNAYMVMGGNTDQGAFLYSTTFAAPVGAWIASPFAISANPTVAALGTDSLQLVADGNQAIFSHQSWNSAASLAIPARRLIFCRVGTQWQNNIPLNLGGANYSDIQVGLFDNLYTAGDFKQTFPTISFTARAYTGAVSLNLTLKQMGRAHLAIRAIDAGGNYSVFELEIWGYA